MWYAILIYSRADQQLIVCGRKPPEPPYLAHVDIQQTVIIDIYYGDTGRPAAILWYSRQFGNVFKVQVASIEIELILSLVGCEEKVDLTIAVEISGAYSAAVVKIHIVKHIKALRGMQRIAEVDAGPGLVQCFKNKRPVFLAGNRMAALGDEQYSRERYVKPFDGYGILSGCHAVLFTFCAA